MLDAASGEVLSGGNGNPVVALALKTRHWVQEKLQIDLEDSPDVSGLVQGLTLGLKNETPEETRELFQRTGTLHLFVVNGLHIGMFTTIMFLLVRLFGAGRVLSVLIVAPLVCFYALLTGSSTGSMRATVMTLIILGGMLADGKPVMLNNLAAAGLVILAWNTNELFMPGFQFSFGVVFTIILLAGPLQNYFAKFGKPDEFLPRALWNRRQRALNYCSQQCGRHAWRFDFGNPRFATLRRVLFRSAHTFGCSRKPGGCADGIPDPCAEYPIGHRRDFFKHRSPLCLTM